MRNDMMNKPIIVDSNFWIALFDPLDVHAKHAARIWEKIDEENFDTVILDCVVNETFSAIGRRFNEKGRKGEVKQAFDRLGLVFKPEEILWAYTYMRDIFPEVTRLLREHDGIFNFHDALIALVAKREELRYILSFDRHFDLFPWVKRISEVEHLDNMIQGEG